MSTDVIARLEKALETATTRIASLESELRGKPKQEGLVDPRAITQGLLLDAPRVMRELGLTPEHINHVQTQFIANTLGDKAPLDMQMRAAQGQQYLAAQQAHAAVADLSRRFDEMTTAQKRQAKREALNAVTALKEKYPHLSKAISAKPDRFLAALDAHGGTAEEFAQEQETALAEIVALVAPPAAQESAGASTASEKTAANPGGQSTEPKSAPLAGSLNSVPPVAPVVNKPGVWNKDKFAEVKDAILKKVSPQ